MSEPFTMVKNGHGPAHSKRAEDFCKFRCCALSMCDLNQISGDLRVMSRSWQHRQSFTADSGPACGWCRGATKESFAPARGAEAGQIKLKRTRRFLRCSSAVWTSSVPKCVFGECLILRKLPIMKRARLAAPPVLQQFIMMTPMKACLNSCTWSFRSWGDQAVINPVPTISNRVPHSEMLLADSEPARGIFARLDLIATGSSIKHPLTYCAKSAAQQSFEMGKTSSL